MIMRAWLGRLSLRVKLLLITVSVLVLGGVAAAWLVMHSYRDTLLQTARASNEALAATIAEYGAAPLVFEDVQGAREILGKLAQNQDVLRATLIVGEDRVFSRYERDDPQAGPEERSVLLALKPVTHQGKRIGALILESSTRSVEARISLIGERIVLGGGLLTALCALLSLRLQSSITRPLARLAATMQRVGSAGELGERVHYAGRDEIGVLYRRFNDMLEQLEQRSREGARTQLWLRTLVDSLPDHVFVFQEGGTLVEEFGDPSQPAPQAQGKTIHDLLPKEAAETLLQGFARTLEERAPVRLEYELERGEKHFEAVVTPLERADAMEARRVLVVARDVTERKRLQAQFIRAQKMEAVGQLAGGIAHDFNNLLAGIIGYAELIKAGKRVPEGAENILEISDRASDLVRQLLTFSRKAAPQRRPTAINDLIARVAGILRHTLDRRIQLSVQLTAAQCTVLGDPSQIESAILNLAVNARDAMPQGGALTIATRVVDLDELAASSMDTPLTPGEYVEICVADTGSGIPAELLARIFEPFFTTKEAGRGTGLGLAAVYGTATSHRGAIRVRSVPSKGSEFRMLLPRVEAEGHATAVRSVPRGTGRLLLLDDEPAVRETATALLGQLGYSVDAFAQPRDALSFFELNHASIDAVIVDMVMPQLNGAEVIQRLRQISPRVRLLIASGYLGIADPLASLVENVPVLSKPFTLAELASAVHALVHEREEAAHVHA